MSAAITLEQILNFLLETPMFGDLDATELSEVVHIMQVQRLRRGQLAFRQGDPGDAWYVLFQGEAEVLKETDLGSGVVAKIGPATCFGEMAVLDGSARSATIRMSEDSTAFRFPRSDFQRLLESSNIAAYKLVYQMALVLASRQRNTTTQYAELLKADCESDIQKSLGPIMDEATLSE